MSTEKGPYEAVLGNPDGGKDLIAAFLKGYAAGQEDRWIQLTKQDQPERNTTAIYWHRGYLPNSEGFPAIADEWRWEHHAKHATHYLKFSTPVTP